jgi:hypothetical protein
LVTVTDATGYNATWTNPAGGPTLLATAPANMFFKGLDFAPTAIPEAASMAMMGLVGGLTGVAVWRRRRA